MSVEIQTQLLPLSPVIRGEVQTDYLSQFGTLNDSKTQLISQISELRVRAGLDCTANVQVLCGMH